jgi:predicted peptidase
MQAWKQFLSLSKILMIKLLISFILSISLMSFSFGQSWQAAYYVSENDSLPFRFVQSEPQHADEKLPLLIFLHGSGERGNDNMLQLIHGGDLFLDAIQNKEIEGMVVFPQCPKEDYWARVQRDVYGNDSLTFTFFPDSTATPAMSLLLGLLDSLSQLPNVDKNRIYIGGLSMGGMGTFELLSRRPELFAAAFPICGGGNPDAVENFNHETAIWVFHGAKDRVVKPTYSQQMVNKMREHNMEVRHSIYPETGHNAWDNAFAEPELLRWIFMQQKP